MRAGGYSSVQQALTPEAAGVVKQAVQLAKRRGHAQVTPLHVANTMLSASSGLLRAACLHSNSHSHPLQCKALELCFNVALNRLPASSSSSPMLGPSQVQYPSISNALVAAFKRAQAHQRRGSIENQQQPVLAVKIELEQLIVSILDDPSVSRVMREAGFSSPQVKANVEKAVSLELPIKENTKIENVTETDQIRKEDVEMVIETLLKGRKGKTRLVIVGESILNIETTVKGLMSRVDKGEVPEDLKEVKFITIPPLYTFCNLQREEVEQKIGELSCLVRSLLGRGVVLYLGDLKWISEYRVNLEQEKSYYCSVEHMIMEIGKLACGVGEIGRFWLMGIATFQTYMRCRSGYSSLENVWGLHPVTIPASILGLSLVSDHREEQKEAVDGRVGNGSCDLLLTDGDVKPACCADCSAKFKAEVQEVQASKTNLVTFSNLPPWLKDESSRLSSNDHHENSIEELCKKWNAYCASAHKQQHRLLGRTLTFPYSSFEHPNPNNLHHQNPNFVAWKDNFNYQLWPCSPSSNPNSTPNSTSSGDTIMQTTDHHTPKFKEFNAQSLNTLCNALENKVPWHKQIVPEIVGTVLQCRSGMLKRKCHVATSSGDNDVKEETWLLFLGLDTLAKERISRELAKVVFGSYSNFVTIELTGFASSEDCPNKRGRDEESCTSYIDRFAEAVSINPHRVFFVVDLEQADYKSRMGVKRAIECGKICMESGEEVSFCDAIVILSCESFSSGRSSRSGSPRQKTEHGGGEEEAGEANCISLNLNISCDNYDVDDQSVDVLGILESVDRRVFFKIHDF